jgi:HEAT repeat protein
MSEQKRTGANLESLMNMLASKDGMIRRKARRSLVALGKPAVFSFIRALRNSRSDQVRWEAAKTLGAIGDTRSIPVLVKALQDSNIDVAWLAAEALGKFKKAPWPSLLRALMKVKPGSDSASLHQGAHHVLRNQKEDGLKNLLETLMGALESDTAPQLTPTAAYDILMRMKENS